MVFVIQRGIGIVNSEHCAGYPIAMPASVPLCRIAT